MSTEKTQIRSSLYAEDKDIAVNPNTRYFYKTTKYVLDGKEECFKEEIGKVHLSYKNPENSYVMIYEGNTYKFDILYRLKKRACYYSQTYLARIMREFFMNRLNDAREEHRIRVIEWEIEAIALHQEKEEKRNPQKESKSRKSRKSWFKRLIPPIFTFISVGSSFLSISKYL